MGFATNQFDPIDDRIISHRVKLLDVICSQNVQATGDLTILAVDVPAGVIVDGQLAVGVTFVVTDVNLVNTTVIPNKVLNTFAVTVAINLLGVEVGLFVVTVNDVVDCPGAGTGPGATIVQKHDVQVEGVAAAVVDVGNLTFNLILNVAINYCLVVSKEAILKVQAAQFFCP